MNGCAPDFKEVVRGALNTGCRYGDLRKAKVADYNRDAGTWFIPDPKAGGARTVQLTEDGKAFFSQLTAGRAGDEWMFTRLAAKGETPAPWQRGNQAQRMKDACKRAKIVPRLRFHELKNCYCSLALDAGMSVWHVSQNTGTSMATIEEHYVKPDAKVLEEAVRDNVPSFGVEKKNVESIT